MSAFWTPPVIWTGEQVFVLACGPSLCADDVERLRGRKVIAVNNAYQLAPWADVLFFTDTEWFKKHEADVLAFQGLVVTTSPGASRKAPEKVKRVYAEMRPSFPSPGSETIRHGRSSGHKAVSLAIAMGAGCVVLLGFDMREVDGRSHFHNEYRNRDAGLYEKSFVPAFRGWNEAARRLKVRVLNATLGSALEEFPMVTLDEVLSCAPS